MYTSKKSMVEALKSQLVAKPDKAVAALLKIYSQQTKSEQATATVQIKNNRGFVPQDAEFLTSLAKFYMSRGFLSAKQLFLLKKRITKYAGQLIELSLSEEKIKTYDKKYFTTSAELNAYKANGSKAKPVDLKSLFS